MDKITYATYGMEVDPNPLVFEMPFQHEGTRKSYRFTFRTASQGELPPLRIANRLLVLEVLPLDGIRQAGGQVDPDLYDHLRRTPWYLLLLLRLLSLREVWINHPWHFATSFGVIAGIYGVLNFDRTLLSRAEILQTKLNRFHEAVWPVEMVRGAAQTAKQTGQSVDDVLAVAGLTRDRYDQFSYVAWAVRKFMSGRNQHPDDYDETVVQLTSMLEQLFMRPREADVTRKLSTRAARLFHSMSPRPPFSVIEGIIRHFYEERSILLHRVYELPSRTISVSSLSEIVRVCLLAFVAIATEGLSKESIVNRLNAGEAAEIGAMAKRYYGDELLSLWASEVELRAPN
jgi:hypothetical protein